MGSDREASDVVGFLALPTVSALICAHSATHSSQMKTQQPANTQILGTPTFSI
jgi:hypothetical protein